MAIDYAKRLEETLNEAGVATTPQAVQVGPRSGSRPVAPDRVTFSTMLRALQELQKRLDESLVKADQLATTLAGGVNEVPEKQPQPTEGMPAFERLAYETMVLAREVARLERVLDRALGALQ